MLAAWREMGVSLCALLHRAIARSDTRCVVRAYTCVNSVKLPVFALSRFKPKDRKIGRTVSSFEMFYFELLDLEILSAVSLMLHPLKNLHSSAKKYARAVLLWVYFEIFYFELLDPEISTNNTLNIFHFVLLDPEI